MPRVSRKPIDSHASLGDGASLLAMGMPGIGGIPGIGGMPGIGGIPGIGGMPGMGGIAPQRGSASEESMPDMSAIISSGPDGS